ncbi:adenosine deaminase [Roseibium porphyridii]|uniref:Adenosine deaminase n=1 Tax=Roseibium porphyridii TaxID=2866279 RepID=A0ABY8EYR4_9HYPH|nr:adenosine deaminase [Roseibium sp. KMA01]WFE88156.1 adenosine deaminase [Roseibium sp. KMA01]
MTTEGGAIQRAEILVPTLDLHCHLRGTMHPSLAFKLAEKHNIHLPISSASCEYPFSGFEEFLSLYDQIGHVIRTADDLRDVAYQYLSHVSESGTRYVEFMISPGHSMENGISFPSQVSAISDAIDQANSECSVAGCMIVTCVRHRGPEEALEIAELATSIESRHVRGFGLTGNERLYDIDAFKGAFLVAKSSGLGLTAHVGEWLPAETVLRAVNSLELSRVGHGISIAENEDVLAELAERKIGFEVCLSSNVILGATKGYELHPARKMLDAGCSLSFSTDDPAYFRTTPKQEMTLAIQHLKLTDTEQWRAFDDSIEMAFCDEETKAYIRSHSLRQKP